jgi:galactonate dehydratase
MHKRWRDLPVFSPPEAHNANDPLAITELRAWRVREPASNRRYTVTRLTTRSGITGYGEGAAADAHDINTAKAAVIGRLAFETEFIRHHLAAVPAMEAALSNAMLDIAAKAAKVPVYQYLGGPTRNRARVLAYSDEKNDDSLLPALEHAKQRGFKAFTFPLPDRDQMTRIQEHVDVIRKRAEHLRSAGGDDSDFVLDGAGSMTPGDAAAVATALEKLHLLWFDEPTAVLTNDALSKITDESVMPVGLGRDVHDPAVFQNLLRWGCIDVLRPCVGLNSIGKIRRMAAIAETHYVAISPHHNGGPIGTVTAIHLAASLPNFFIQQIPLPTAERDRAMRAAITNGDHESAKDGFAPLINSPGLGIQVNEAALGEFSEETI